MENILSNLQILDAKAVFTDSDMIVVLDSVGDIVDHFGAKDITPIGNKVNIDALPEPLSVIQQDITLLTQSGFAKKYTVKEMREFAKSQGIVVKGLREKALVAKLYQERMGGAV